MIENNDAGSKDLEKALQTKECQQVISDRYQDKMQSRGKRREEEI